MFNNANAYNYYNSFSSSDTSSSNSSIIANGQTSNYSPVMSSPTNYNYVLPTYSNTTPRIDSQYYYPPTFSPINLDSFNESFGSNKENTNQTNYWNASNSSYDYRQTFPNYYVSPKTSPTNINPTYDPSINYYQSNNQYDDNKFKYCVETSNYYANYCTETNVSNKVIPARKTPVESTSTPLQIEASLLAKELKKSRKHQLSEQAVDIMNEWFEDHLNNPYPQPEEKERLAKLGNITVKQVTAWFSNRRNRSQNTKPKRMKRVLENEMNSILSQIVQNQPEQQQIIEKLKSTFNARNF